jgi:hypothetical protein
MSRSPLTVVITDGLGNQMFQYASALGFAQRRGVPLLVDGESGFQWNIHGRRYELDAFRLTSKTVPATRGRIVHAAIRQLEDMAMNLGHYHQPALDWWMANYATRVTGFLQSPLYFKGSEAVIRDEFRLRRTPPDAVAAMADSGKGKETVGIHIRQQHAFSANGEKVTPALSGPKYEGEISAYYRAAVKLIQQRVADPHWVVVTDTEPFDPASIGITGGTASGSTGRVSVRYPDSSLSPVYDQWLLSQCKHIIIGRSTFSWWAAWLAGPNRGITCAPAIFRPGGGLSVAKDLYPKEWEVL